MPLYEYICKEHGEFEVLVKVSDENTDTHKCPVCQNTCAKIQMPSTFGFAMGIKVRVPKSLDLAVGKAANNAWGKHYDRKERRNKSK